MVELTLLGEVTLRVDGRPVDLGPARQRCVLAALAVEAGQLVTTDLLVERVWGERAPHRVRATLHTYLSRLRRVGAEIARRPGGYVLLVDERAVDLHRFRALWTGSRSVSALTGALALWRGEPLAGLDGEWVEAERARLLAERLAARLDLLDARLAAGHGGELVAELGALVAEHPLDERIAAQYLLALHRAGRSADALAHYRRLRDRMVEELGTEPDTRVRDLHQRILGADPALVVPARGTTAVPRQLPAAPRHFTGREAELAALSATLDAAEPGSTTVISAIAGSGGIGKTWLALHWAHRNADRFPDGQLFVDLRGFSPDGEPMSPSVALRGFLQALGVEAGRVPVDGHARAALFRSLVTDRRMLLVADNARDADQVVPLLPGGTTCTVLVTSRSHLRGLVTGHGAHHLALDVLTDAEARALLAGRLGPDRVDDAATAELVALCGGFPLALGIVASHAQTHPRLRLADLVAELRELGLGALDDSDPTASLPTVLSWSLDALPEDRARAFALLGTAPGADIGGPAAARLLGLPEPDAEAVLADLEQASLITRDSAGRVRMHDLLRRYAASVARDNGPALRRLLDFYTRTAVAGDRVIYPHRAALPFDPSDVEPLPPADEAAAMAWFDTEHANLLAAQQTAIAHGWHDTVWTLAWAVTAYHQLRGHHQVRLDVWYPALAAADHLAEPLTGVLAHRFLGSALADMRRHDEAVGHLRRALDLASGLDVPNELANIHRTLAWTYAQSDDLRTALRHAVEALELHRSKAESVWVADALNDVGWLHCRLGDYATARDHCQAALDLHRRYRKPHGEATTLDSLGYIEHRSGDHRRAIRRYHEALALRRELDDTYETANNLDALGHPHLALGEVEQARAVWLEALELYQRQERDLDADRVRRQLADLPR
ncbi:BTAD domain-containing putative transcriptional regulator [Saccharothrix sp. NPDC042600]|uniref:AfsR/SARP family transcriptional regulator n=1 Tax=Saccharothrix TaxID=2071 RepID=UPI00340B2A93|nr:BTAD domain-containing putative transcriptional regulator [Saccharothrix mutabilis subsp. capreolus]